jgi:hypothetical protein
MLSVFNEPGYMRPNNPVALFMFLGPTGVERVGRPSRLERENALRMKSVDIQDCLGHTSLGDVYSRSKI